MSKVLITRSKLDDLAVAVSAKSGATLPLTIAQMQTAVEGIQPGGVDIPVFTDMWSADWSTETVTCDKTFAECLALYNDGMTGAYLHSYVDDPTSTWEDNRTITAVDGDSTQVVYVAYSSMGATGDYIYHSNGTIEVVMPSSYAQSLTVTQNGYYYPQKGTYTDVTVSVPSSTPTLQTKSVSYTPSESQQTATVTADSGYDGLDEVNVTVGAVSSTYVGSGITRRSSSDLTASGATVSVPSGYYSSNASKAVASGSATTPATTVTANPSISVSSSGLITATASATKSVTPTVSAGYVSSGTAGTITVSGSNTSQLTTQGATTITPSTSSQTAVASGVYTTGAVTVSAMPSGTAGTPTATKGSVSNHSVSVTPSVTNTTGYITGSTKTGTAVTVTASELVSGTKSITENGTGIDVANYASVDVDIQGGSTYSLTNIVPTQTVATTTSNLYGYVGLIPSYTAYVQSGEWYLVTYDSNEYVVTGYYGANSEILVGDYQLITSNVEWLETPFMVEHNLTNNYFFLGSRVSGNHTLKVDKINFLDDGVTLINKTITANGTYNASSDNADGFETVTVNVPSSTPNLQAKTNISPTTSSQTITADSGYDGLSSVQINAMPSGTAGTPTATKGTVSNHSVTVTPSVTNSTGYITGSTKTGTAVTVSASELVSGSQTITQNGTVNVTNLAEVVVNVSGGGSTKNMQAYIGRASRTANSYGATTVTLTVAKTGTYNVSWTAWRSSSSGTMGTNLHRNSTSGTNQTTWTNTYGQQIELTNQSYTAGDVLTLYATSGSNSRTINVANLIIEEQ